MVEKESSAGGRNREAKRMLQCGTHEDRAAKYYEYSEKNSGNPCGAAATMWLYWGGVLEIGPPRP
jgi:hypothetical protein